MGPIAPLERAPTRETRGTRARARDEAPPTSPSTETQLTTNSHNKHYCAAFFLRISASCFSRFALALSCSSMTLYFLGSG